MKKSLLLFGLMSFLLIGCSAQNDLSVKFTDKKLEFYSMLEMMDPDKQPQFTDPAKAKEIALKGEVTYKVHPNYQNVLYTDFKSYFSNFLFRLDKSVSYKLTDESFTITNAENQTLFIAGYDNTEKVFFYGGSFGSAVNVNPDISKLAGSLFADLQMKQENIIEPHVQFTFSSYYRFSKDLPVVYQNNQLIAPVGLFDSAFALGTSTNHYYDMTKITQYDNIVELVVPIGEAGNDPLSITKNYFKEHGMPKDLQLLDKASLYFVMENYYGLQYHKGIDSMSNYFDLLGYDKSLLDDDPNKRCFNYFELFATLDDDHTGFSTIAEQWGDSKEFNHRSSRSNMRKDIITSLRTNRNEVFGTTSTVYGIDGTVQYSTSGETAYFYFDNFTFDLKPYDPANRDELWKTDSYFYFVHQFEAIKAHGGVKRVIIDDSCNGGGTIGIAIKLLALISKDNNGFAYQYNPLTQGVTKMNARVDSNQDGKYDADDVYGDDFEILILTSPGSFSCGNLFPIYAQTYLDAKVIGKNSGGGECVVGSSSLPSGRIIQYSSNSIICKVDENTKEITRDVELGAKPNIDLPYYKFFDINYIESLMNQ